MSKEFRHSLQLKQLQTLDPAAHRAAAVALKSGFVQFAGEITVKAMQAALTRLTAQEAEFDLLVASRSVGGGDTGDVYARVTWVKRAGQPKETPEHRVTLVDLLPALTEYRLISTQKTATEVIRKYRKVEERNV